MNKSRKFLLAIEQFLPWMVLAIILLYTYAKLFQQPFLGFRWNPSGQVVFIFTAGNSVTPLQVGDQLLQAGSVSWSEYRQDLLKPLIDRVHAGQVIELTVDRNGQKLIIPWTLPGSNPGEISDRVWNESWIGFAFWVFGTLVFLNLRPKNERWRLLIAFNYLTAIWLVVGTITINHFWSSTILMRVCIWLCIPVYLHLHWAIPRPLGKLPPFIVRGAYLLAALMAMAQVFQLIPSNLYSTGFLFSIVGSLILLVIHAIRQPDMRNELRSLFLNALLSFAPSLVVGVLGMLTTLPPGLGGLGLLSLPLLPMAYLYAAQRRQLGDIEMRFNQALSVYIFVILITVLLLPVIVLMNRFIPGTGAALVVGITVLISAVLITIFAYRPVQAFIEHSILGISLPPRDLAELYSERITTSASFSGLQTILETEILPRLHIRQFAFFRVEKGIPLALHALGVQDLPLQSAMLITDQAAGKYRPAETIGSEDPLAWVRLSLELKISGELVGIWLFGRRDPDDYYSLAEISMLQSLANQTAIAISNIVQTERVSEMYQQDIGRHEQERMRLAMELHDSILNQMAVLLMKLDDQSISPDFQSAYDELTRRLREIVSGLRPAMLNYGLKPALDELIESLIERDNNGLQVSLELQTDDERYPAEVEQHLFRIVQEASENALRHGKARKINISGALKPDEIELVIADNGSGFDTDQGFELADLLSNKHFGLAGMLERARLIGGDVRIDSDSETGTQVRIRWIAIGKDLPKTL